MDAPALSGRQQFGDLVAANDLASMLTLLQGVSSAIGGAAVSANGAALSLLAKAL